MTDTSLSKIELKKYSIYEIEEMRRCITEISVYQSNDMFHKDIVSIEEYLRTYMIGGITVEELQEREQKAKAEYMERIKQNPPTELSVYPNCDKWIAANRHYLK